MVVPSLSPGALDGVRALTLVDGPGAYGPRLLRGLGAEVIRLERPGGSLQRHRPPPSAQHPAPSVPTSEEGAPSLYFLHYHTGMQGITLDPTAPGGLDLLRRLLDTVDVVFDNGELQSWGVDLDALAAGPRPLVVVSVTPFGLDGPRVYWQGGDLIAQAMSGMLGIFGYAEERPARFGPEQASEMSGLAAALGALIALYGAQHGGGGEVIDIAMQRVAALVSFQMWNASIHDQFGFDRRRLPRTDGLPVGLYEAADGYFLLAAWRKVDEALALLDSVGESAGLRDLRAELGDAQFIAHADADAAMIRFAATRSRAEVVELIQRFAMIGLPVHDAADLVADPFLQSRGTFVEVEAPGLPSPLLDSGAPVRFSETPYVAAARPPLLGEHNSDVYGSLGLTEAQIAALRGQGAV